MQLVFVSFLIVFCVCACVWFSVVSLLDFYIYIIRFFFQIFNILAVIFANVAENPYYASNRFIKFNSIAIAGACFSFITLVIVLVVAELRDSLKWIRNELLIQCVLIIVYVYGCVTMVWETLDCYHTLNNGCPRQLTATVRNNVHSYICLIYAFFFWPVSIQNDIPYMYI